MFINSHSVRHVFIYELNDDGDGCCSLLTHSHTHSFINLHAYIKTKQLNNTKIAIATKTSKRACNHVSSSSTTTTQNIHRDF